MGASFDAAGAGSHTPVLYQQVLSALQPSAGSRHIDGTIGAGGHAAGILQTSAPDGELLGLDRDPQALRLARERLSPFGPRLHLRQASFALLADCAERLGWNQVHGILFDLGLSSMQLSDPARGFSFQLDGPLDMRFDPDQPTSAADLVNGLPEQDLADLLRRYGEEPRPRRVARAIVDARPLHTTRQLADVVARAAGRKRRGLHPATRTFQALRIAVNGELEALEAALPQALDLLAPGGRLVVIAFHSLEDRLVKNFLRDESRDCLCPPGQPACTCGHHATLRVLTPKPVRPAEDEVRRNPRARSARMRVAERLAQA
ncbi:MAG: 16S rRNA (cytosine(1402)-N(4))-methyltransferase RsmH [Chloroflexota bacterium]